MRVPARAPHFIALDLHDPLAAPRALAGLPGVFLLHGGAAAAGWSFFGADPYATFRGGSWNAARAAWRRTAGGWAREHEAPFQGGAVGYWSYDFGRRLERMPAIARDDLGLPDFVFGLYDVVGAFDHARGRAWLFATGLPLEGGAAAARARHRLDAFARRLAGPRAGRTLATPNRPPSKPRMDVRVRGTFDAASYARAIERIQEHIRSGDLFQANLSQRWSLETPQGAPRATAVLDALAHRSPAPFSAYLECGDHAIVSASPERFLEVRGRAVRTRPIKGTRPRATEPGEDARLAAELLASAKDRAENVMIVDVLRNDLGRVCEPGTVMVPELCALERFAQVFHLTSTVEGRLAGGRDALDLFEAAFPGGSITGAPKLRAMEILETLEPVRRHVYTGSVGYLDWSGDADWSIAIRTALLHGDAVHWNAGGGITADSDPAAEHRESLDKALGIRLALQDVCGPLERASRDAPAAAEVGR